MSRVKPSLLVIGILLLGLLLFVVNVGLRVADEVWPGIEEASQLPPFPVEQEARLLAELEYLRDRGLFSRRGRAHDAAPVLNPLVTATPPIEGMSPAWWAGDAFPEVLVRPNLPLEQWLDDPELVRKYDLSFLAEWRELDHWNWAAAEPFAGHLARQDECGPSTPIPNVISLQTLARVRMAQGYHDGELEAAARDTEQLALLAASTDTMVGTMVGLAILGIEASVVQRAIVDDRLNGALVPTWHAEELERARGALFALGGIFALDPTTPFAQELAGRADDLPGVCAGLTEGVNTWALLRPIIERPWPGEADHSRYVVAIDTALASSGCEIAGYRAVWAQAVGPWDCEIGDEGSSEWMLHLLRVPWVRSPGFTVFRAIATPNFCARFLEGE